MCVAYIVFARVCAFKPALVGFLKKTCMSMGKYQSWPMASPLTRFRRTSEGDVIPGPEQGFDIVGGYFSADLKSFLSHSINMHFPITLSSMAF